MLDKLLKFFIGFFQKKVYKFHKMFVVPDFSRMPATTISSIMSFNPQKWAECPVADNCRCTEHVFWFIENEISEYQKTFVVTDRRSNFRELG